MIRSERRNSEPTSSVIGCDLSTTLLVSSPLESPSVTFRPNHKPGSSITTIQPRSQARRAIPEVHTTPANNWSSDIFDKETSKGFNPRKNLLFLATTTLIVAFCVASPLLYLVLSRFGFGRPLPSQPFLTTSPAIVPVNALEVVAILPTPPGKVAVSNNHRIFFSFHPEYHSTLNVAELLSQTSWKAFPSLEFQSKFQSVLAVRVDVQDRLWLLDYAHHAVKTSPQLFVFQLASRWKKDELLFNVTIPSSVAGFGSMLSDMQIDSTGDYAYIADTSLIAATPALLVFSVATQSVIRLLEGHTAMQGLSVQLSVAGRNLGPGPLGWRLNVHGLSLDRTNDLLYVSAPTSNSLFAISTSVLQDYVRDARANNHGIGLQDQMKLVSSQKPVSFGLSTDGKGGLWTTAVEHNAIVVGFPTTPKNSSLGRPAQIMRWIKVVESEMLLRWPDGLCFGPDGLYISNSALHLKLTRGNLSSHAPFHILKLPTKFLKSKKLLSSRSFLLPPPGH
jgi:hypothetical protein